MLGLFGRGYVIDHCVSLLRKKSEEKAYRYYVTDSLRAIANVLYKSNGGDGLMIDLRYFDVVNQKKEAEETKTADEIIYSFQKRLGAKK